MNLIKVHIKELNRRLEGAYSDETKMKYQSMLDAFILADEVLEEDKRLFINYLTKWQKQLSIHGVNSKMMVQNDIQYLLKKYKGEQ